MSGFNLPPGVSAGDIPGNQRERLPMKVLAARINAYLKKFEADPKINRYTEEEIKRVPSFKGLKPYYWPAAGYAGGSRIFISYINYQGPTDITRDEAERYLAKLDKGFVGRHFEALR